MVADYKIDTQASDFIEKLAHWAMRPFSAGLAYSGSVEPKYGDEEANNFLLKHVFVDGVCAIELTESDDAIDWIFDAIDDAEKKVFDAFNGVSASALMNAKDIDVAEVFSESTKLINDLGDGFFDISDGDITSKTFVTRKLLFPQLASAKYAGGLFRAFVCGDVDALMKKCRAILSSVQFDQAGVWYDCLYDETIIKNDAFQLACFAKALEVNFNGLKKSIEREITAASSNG